MFFKTNPKFLFYVIVIALTFFLQPIAQANYSETTGNAYSAFKDPINFIDPLGLQTTAVSPAEIEQVLDGIVRATKQASRSGKPNPGMAALMWSLIADLVFRPLEPSGRFMDLNSPLASTQRQPAPNPQNQPDGGGIDEPRDIVTIATGGDGTLNKISTAERQAVDSKIESNLNFIANFCCARYSFMCSAQFQHTSYTSFSGTRRTHWQIGYEEPDADKFHKIMIALRRKGDVAFFYSQKEIYTVDYQVGGGTYSSSPVHGFSMPNAIIAARYQSLTSPEGSRFIIHEFGHYIGLGGHDEGGPVMDSFPQSTEFDWTYCAAGNQWLSTR